MVKVSIITPVSRIENLPIILKSLEGQYDFVKEWIIIYDGTKIPKIDRRVLMYSKKLIKIRMFIDYGNNPDTGKAWKLRNIGIDNAKGDYLYFLDDDNILHPDFLKSIQHVVKPLVLINQRTFLGNRWKSSNEVTYKCTIDTAQILVKNGLKARWGPTTFYMEESIYLENLKKEINFDTDIEYITYPLTYYNYLRHG